MYTITRKMKNNPAWVDPEPLEFHNTELLQDWIGRAIADERGAITKVDSDLPDSGEKVLLEFGNEQIIVTVSDAPIIDSNLSPEQSMVIKWLANEEVREPVFPINASPTMITAFNFIGSEPFVIARKGQMGLEVNLCLGIFGSSYVTTQIATVVKALITYGEPVLYWIPFHIPNTGGGHLAAIPFNVPNISNRENVPSVLLGVGTRHPIQSPVYVETDKGQEPINPENLRVAPSGLPVRRIMGFELYNPIHYNPFTDIHLSVSKYHTNTIVHAHYSLNDNIHNPHEALTKFQPDHDMAMKVAEGVINVFGNTAG